MIVTIWTIHAKAGMMEEFLQAVREFDLGERPAGCKETLPLIDVAVEQLMAEPSRPNAISIIQRWTTLEGAVSAGGSDRRMQFMSQLGYYIESASVRFYQTLDDA